MLHTFMRKRQCVCLLEKEKVRSSTEEKQRHIFGGKGFGGRVQDSYARYVPQQNRL